MSLSDDEQNYDSEAERPDATTKQIENALSGVTLAANMEQLVAGVSVPRTKSDWSVAMWRPGEGMAEVMVKREHTLDRMGIMKGRRHLLYIEEAVYMLGRSDLLLVVEDRSLREFAPRHRQRLLSLQEAYELMMDNGVSMEQFQVYCHLGRSGFIVLRHSDAPAAGSAPLAARKGSAAKKGKAKQKAAQSTDKQTLPAAATKAPPAAAAAAVATAARATTGAPAAGVATNTGTAGPVAVTQATACQVPQAVVSRDPDDSTGGAVWDRFPNLRPLQTADVARRDAVVPQQESIVYDVWQPNANFARNKKSPPDLRICMATTSMPSAGSMARVQAKSGAVPVLYAIVDHGDIDFFSAQQQETPAVWQ